MNNMHWKVSDTTMSATKNYLENTFYLEYDLCRAWTKVIKEDGLTIERSVKLSEHIAKMYTAASCFDNSYDELIHKVMSELLSPLHLTYKVENEKQTEAHDE